MLKNLSLAALLLMAVALAGLFAMKSLLASSLVAVAAQIVALCLVGLGTRDVRPTQLPRRSGSHPWRTRHDRSLPLHSASNLYRCLPFRVGRGVVKLVVARGIAWDCALGWSSWPDAFRGADGDPSLSRVSAIR